MRYLLPLCWLCLFSGQAIAQTPEQLQQELQSSSNDSIKVQHLLQFCTQAFYDYPQQCLEYAQKGIHISQQSPQNWAKKAELTFMNVIGIVYLVQNELPKAETAFRRLIQQSKKFKNSNSLANAHINLSNVFAEREIYDSCIVHDLAALKIYEATNNPKRAKSYNNLGLNYKKINDYPTAIQYFKKAISVKLKFKNNTDLKLGNSYQNLGNAYAEINQVDSGEYYYQLALQEAKKEKDSLGIALITHNIGSLYLDQGLFEIAEDYLIEGLALLQQTAPQMEYINSYHELAKLYMKQQHFAKANDYLIMANRSISELKLDFSHYKQINLKLAARLAGRLGQWQKADSLSAWSYTLLDSLHFKEVRNKTHEVLLQLDNERKESYIGKLEQDTEIQQLRNEKLIRQRWILIISALFLFAVSGLFFWLYRWRTTTNQKLRQLSATKNKLFSIIAHDIKNPLIGMHTITKNIEKDIQQIDKEDIAYFIASLRETSADLLTLMDNLLYWSVSESGTLSFQPQELHPFNMLQKSIQITHNSTEEKQLVITNNIPPDLKIQADSKMLSIIFLNLLSNAVKFSPRGGKIQLDAHRKDNWIQISIQDEGPGIPAEQQSQLFELKSEHSQRDELEGKGTGLGLILCKELVERHGGRISVESQPTKGSTFTVSLPINTSV